jgi:hypothetical protein
MGNYLLYKGMHEKNYPQTDILVWINPKLTKSSQIVPKIGFQKQYCHVEDDKVLRCEPLLSGKFSLSSSLMLAHAR